MTELEILDGYFRAVNYLSLGQLYLLDNPLLRRPLKQSDIKKKIVGHWGTIPGQNFIYTHLNRVINKYDLEMIYLSGPGHGGNFMIANTYLEGSYTEIYPEITQDEIGMQKLFKRFSFPGGVPSHVAPETPGSIHEGGELGYSLAHAFGAVLDKPNLIAVSVVGDGEAETGPLAGSWHCNKFINPKRDGIVLPILHLNGYKISNPTVFSRMTNQELASYFYGLGYKAYLVEGDEQLTMHRKMMATMDAVVEDIKALKTSDEKMLWPVIILRTPKGWTGPAEVDGRKIEGSFRAHQVPITMDKEDHLSLLEAWLKSYKPEELFDKNGTLLECYKSLCPSGNKRMGANLNTNGGLLLKELILPNFTKYGVKVKKPGSVKKQDMLVLSGFVRDIFKCNDDHKNFRIFGPDETMSNRLYDVFEYTKRSWQMDIKENDEHVSKDGRVMDSYLSEHVCEGMLEGYLLTGRHGFFASYEAFIRIVDSMAAQHAKWLKVCNELPWRKPIASLNFILTSNVWQQDHNGYTHQDPGFLDHMANKKVDVVRMYLPPDANCLLSCVDHCLRSKNYVNVVVASKHPSFQWLNMDEAVEHCTKGIGTWDFVSNDENPDIIMACAGDTPTLEMIAATKLLKSYLPEVKVRFINVVDLMKLDSTTKHPHALTDEEYDELFTKDKPIVFAYHGYPTLIHELTYFRHNHNIHVHGYNEEGTITTAFDMRVKNKIDRFNLVIEAVKNLDIGERKNTIINEMEAKLKEHASYIVETGEDLDEIKNWEF